MKNNPPEQWKGGGLRSSGSQERCLERTVTGTLGWGLQRCRGHMSQAGVSGMQTSWEMARSRRGGLQRDRHVPHPRGALPCRASIWASCFPWESLCSSRQQMGAPPPGETSHGKGEQELGLGLPGTRTLLSFQGSRLPVLPSQI